MYGGCPEDVAMKLRRTLIVLDAAELGPVSAFWAGVLGGTVHEDDDEWHSVWVGDGPQLAVQLAPGHVPPEWPDGTPQQVHLDLWIEDLESAHREVLSRGARLLQAASDPVAAEGWQVYAPPGGHLFCLCSG